MYSCVYAANLQLRWYGASVHVVIRGDETEGTLTVVPCVLSHSNFPSLSTVVSAASLSLILRNLVSLLSCRSFTLTGTHLLQPDVSFSC